MAGAGGKQVGQVSIRVVPDLGEFRKELREELEKWERNPLTIKVQADVSKFRSDIEEASRGLTAEVDASAQTAGMRRDIEAATEGLDAEVEVGLDGDDLERSIDRFKNRYLSKFNKLIGEVEANIPLTVDGEAVRKEIKSQEKEFKELLKQITPKLDEQTLTDLRRDVDLFYNYVYRKSRSAEFLNLDNSAAVKRAVKRINERDKIEIDLLLKYEQFEEQFEKAKADSEKLWADLDAKLEIRVDDGQVTRLRSELSDRIIVPARIQVDYDTDRIVRGFALAGVKIKRAIGGTLDGVVEIFEKIAGLASRFSPESIITGLAIVAAVAAIAAPAVALLSGALLTIPAALAGIATPIGVIALGLEGIKKAAETAKPAFDGLKKAISDTFANPETGLIKGFEVIRDRLIPGIQLPLQGVAESLSSAFNNVIDTLSSPEGLNNLQRTIDNISAGIRTAIPGLQSFTDGFTTLVAELSGGFPGIGEWFSQLGADFSAWIDKISANGQLDQAMQALKGTLGELGGIIGDLASWGFENLSDPAFGAKMEEFAANLRSLVNDTLPLLESGFNGVADVVDVIATSINSIQSALDGIEFPNIADMTGIGWLLKPFQNDDAKDIGQQIGLDLTAGFEAGTKLGAGSLSDIGPAVQQQIQQAIKVSAEDQKQALRSAFTAGGVDTAVSQQLVNQVEAAVQGAKDAMANLGPELQSQIDSALIPLATIADRVGAAFSTLAPAVNSAFTTAFAGVQAQITGQFAFIELAIGTQASKIGNSIGSAFANVPQRIGQALAGVAQAVSGALAPVQGAVLTVMAQAAQAAATGGSQVAAAAGASFAQVPPTIQGALAPCITTVSTICQQMVSTALSFAGAMESAGRSIGASFAAGIASSEGLVSSAANALLGAARKFFPNSPAKEGPFSGAGWVDKSGAAVGEGFAGGIQDSIGGVLNIAKVLMQQVKDVFGNAEGVVFNFNFGGANTAATQATTAFSGLGTQIADISTQAVQMQDNLGQALAPTNVSASESKQQIEDLSRNLAELEIQRKALELAKSDPGADKGAIKAQLEQIRQQKLALGLQKNQLEYQQKYGSAVSDTATNYAEVAKKAAMLPFDFGKAVGDQFMSDLNIGGGAITAAMDQALQYGSQFVFNVGNMDDALFGQQTLQRKQSIGYVGR